MGRAPRWCSHSRPADKCLWTRVDNDPSSGEKIEVSHRICTSTSERNLVKWFQWHGPETFLLREWALSRWYCRFPEPRRCVGHWDLSRHNRSTELPEGLSLPLIAVGQNQAK